MERDLQNKRVYEKHIYTLEMYRCKKRPAKEPYTYDKRPIHMIRDV